tara:strand:- start:655 stop:891 length:237 start_codon:yes stop_codon:yes gene_type:complete
MDEEEYDFFISLGENIIDNANKKETLSIEAVNQLTPLQAFTLGVSIVFYGFETNKTGCDNILNKAIEITGTEAKSSIH